MIANERTPPVYTNSLFRDTVDDNKSELMQIPTLTDENVARTKGESFSCRIYIRISPINHLYYSETPTLKRP